MKDFRVKYDSKTVYVEQMTIDYICLTVAIIALKNCNINIYYFLICDIGHR